MAVSNQKADQLSRLPTAHVPIVINEILKKHKEEKEKMVDEHNQDKLAQTAFLTYYTIAKCAYMLHGNDIIRAKDFIERYDEFFEDGDEAETLVEYVEVLKLYEGDD